MKKIFALTITLFVLTACATPQTATPAQPSPSADTARAEVRALVEEFGLQLKNVSLLAPDAAEQIEAVYAPYITDELLAEWQADPAQAPGRQTSSPWPGRIEIGSIEQLSVGAYLVLGSVIEVTSDSNAASTVEIELTVTRVEESWRISALEQYQLLP